MTIYETVGGAWIIFTSALGTFIVIVGAYRSIRATLDATSAWRMTQERLLTRGDIEEKRDILTAAQLRHELETK